MTLAHGESQLPVSAPPPTVGGGALVGVPASSAPPSASLTQGGAQLEAVPKPCLTGSTSDDLVAYSYGAGFRPAATWLFVTGLALVAVLVVLGRRWPALLRRSALTLGLLLVATSLGMGWMIQQLPPYEQGSAHEHADLAIRVRGTVLDLTAQRFQSEEGNVLSDFAHLHDGIDTVVHSHARGVTYGYFLWTIHLPLRGGCMVQPDGTRLCDSGTERWTAVVNGQVEPNLRDRAIHDLDRVLLNYGSEPPEKLPAIAERTVTRDACLYSKQCPERGPPPMESCGS